jgi:hypothetical protein
VQDKQREGVLPMKKNRITLSLVSSLVFLLFFTGCGSKSSGGGASVTSGSSTQERPVDKPDKLRPVLLGKAEDFAILAYSNVTSIPASSISGKVGLMPGARDMIKVTDAEVAGGAPDIMAADDETDPPNFLSNAKVDMVSAYTKAAGLIPDSDKQALNSSIGGKKLKPGIYKWTGDLVITSDFSLEGDDKAIWIFKVPGHLKVSDGIKMILTGGAKASNVFWQVAGSAILGPTSEFAGSILAQQFIELGYKSVLNGRAFAKNGYVQLNQATVTKP